MKNKMQRIMAEWDRGGLVQPAVAQIVEHGTNVKVCDCYDKDYVELIITAVNSCIAINPDNPQAVAGNIEGMRKLAELVFASSATWKDEDILEINSNEYAEMKKLAFSILSSIGKSNIEGGK